MRKKPVIAVLGTDGSGKTTILNAVVPRLEKELGGNVVVHHLKPDLLPPLGRLRGVKHEKGYVCTDPHGSKPSGFIGSLIRITYLTADYILGYWFKVRLTLRRKGTVAWIFDRYAYDILTDPRRFRIRLPKRIIRFFLWFMPRPDLVICLGGDPEKIFRRKPETSLDDVKRQIIEQNELAARLSNVHMIDTTVSIEDTISTTMKAFKELRYGQ